MGKTLFTMLLAGAVFTLQAAPLSFGPAFDKTRVVPVAEIIANPAGYLQQEITVSGTIQAVCKKQGCWMTLAAAEDEPAFRIKVRDGDMVFPLSSMGKTAYAHGRIQPLPMNLQASIDYLAEQAEKSGSVFDPTKVTEPVTLYQLVPTSVEISD
jgi:hypothetical protein